MGYPRYQKGFLSLIGILAVVVVSLICTAAAYQFVSDTQQVGNSLNSSQAFYMAQSGVNYAKHAIEANTATCGASFSNVSFSGASGVFTVTSSLNSVTHQCTLTSTGGVPNLTNPVGKRTLQAVLISTGIASSPVMASGPITISGNAVISNTAVSANSSNYSGATVVSSGTVSLGGSANTAVNGANPSSTSGSMKADIIQNDSSLTSANLFSQYFSAPITQIAAAPTTVQVINESQLSSAVGGIYYANSGMTLNSNATVGTAANPAILIVNGDLKINGNFTFYGLIYATGNLNISGTADIIGAVAAQTSIQKIFGNANITFDTAVLNSTANISPSAGAVLHFEDAPQSIQEIIS